MQDWDDLMANQLAEWGPYLPPGTVGARAAATVRLLAAQDRYFGDLDEDAMEPLETVAGSDWRCMLLRGLGNAFAKHPVHDLFAVQPSSAPVHLLPRLVAEDPGEGMDRQWRVDAKPVTLVTRSLAVRLPHLLEPAICGRLHAPIAEFLFEEALNTIMHEALARALARAPEAATPPDGAGTLADRVVCARTHAHGKSGHLPNIAVINYKHQFAMNGVRVVPLPLFPEGKLLLLYRGLSPLFGSIAWVPFVFQFYAVADAEECSDKDFRRYPKGLAMSIRHHIEITEPSSLVAVRLEEDSE